MKLKINKRELIRKQRHNFDYAIEFCHNVNSGARWFRYHLPLATMDLSGACNTFASAYQRVHEHITQIINGTSPYTRKR